MRQSRLTASTSVLIILCAMSFINYVDRTNMSTAAIAIQADFGLTNKQIGFAFSAFAVTYGLAMIPTSLLADRIGPYKTLVICGVMWGGGTLLTGFVGSYAMLLLARFVVGLGESPIIPASSQAMTTWIPRDRRGFAQGITHAFARLGNAATPLIVAALVAAGSWRYAFIVLGVISLGWTALWARTYHENPADHPAITTDELEKLSPSSRSTHVPPLRWGPFLRTLWPATLASFCHGWVLWFFLNWMPLYFSHNFGLNLRTSAIFTSLVFAGGVVGTTLGGSLSDWVLRRTGNIRHARRSVVILGFLTPLVFMVPLFMHPSVPVAAFCLGMSLFLSELVTAPLWAVAMDLAPRHAATSSGVMNTGLAIAATVSPPIVGWLVDTTGNWQSAIGLSMVILLLGPVAAMFIHADEPYVDEESVPVRELGPAI